MYQSEGLKSDDELRNMVMTALPAYLNQEDDSNNQRVLSIIADIAVQSQDTMLALSDMLNIHNARGNILQWFADDWSVHRIDDDDEFLRFQVTLAMLKSRLGSSTNDFKLLISMALGINPSEFHVKDGDEIESMKITNIPFNFDETDNRERKKKLFEATIQEVMPVEYKLQEIQYATNSTATVYVGMITQHLRTTHAGLMTSRANQITHHIYVGAVTQQWRRTYAELKGVES